MTLFPLAMDWDGSIVAQTKLSTQLGEIVPLRARGDHLRVWAESACLKELRNQWALLHEQHPQPWLTFLGSGDFHHMTLVLLESLPVDQRPSTLIVIDNHPDWFLESPSYHCGNWVGTALKNLSWLKQIILIGVDSEDLKGYRFWRAPWDDLCRGRLQVIPYRISKVTIPFRRCSQGTNPTSARKTSMGVEWTFQTLLSGGVDQTFRDLAITLRGESVYLSIDKDCLLREQLVTDWDQGGLSVDELLSGVRCLSASVRLCGADICGDRVLLPLRNWLKRIDTGRWFNSGSRQSQSDACQSHERVNLALLEALCVGHQVVTT